MKQSLIMCWEPAKSRIRRRISEPTISNDIKRQSGSSVQCYGSDKASGGVSNTTLSANEMERDVLASDLGMSRVAVAV